jgi:hypothetical protein
MAMVLPQVALHRIIWKGIQDIKNNLDILDDIFQYYTVEPINRDYGTPYIENIKKWISQTEIPVVQAWSINPQQAPQIAIRLASEQEDESKAGINDYFGEGENAEIGTSPFIINLDILLMSTRNSDEALWIYYIVNYILFKNKRQAERLGLQLQTFSATDNSRDLGKLAENIWVRTIKFKCVVQNFWDAEPYLDIEEVDVDVESEPLFDEESDI